MAAVVALQLMHALANATLPTGFTAFEIPVTVNQPRTVLSLSPDQLLVLERGSSSVVLVYDADQDGTLESRSTVIDGASLASSLNHGLAIAGDYIYASSDRAVYRWPVMENWENLTKISTDMGEIVIDNINQDGSGGAPFGHTTRTLAFDESSTIYVSVGSGGNVDPDSFRSRIRRFRQINNTTNTTLPIDFLTGEVFADGLRNEVGLAFDRHGVLWGVENGADKLVRDDLGGDIHNDNPAEELHAFRRAGRHYGYPYCWTEYLLNSSYARGRGTAWAWPSFMDTVSDEDCRTKYAPATLAMQAHSAPLGITFYNHSNRTASSCRGGFPASMDGYAFIAFHGSWNREVPTGYKVVYVAMNESGQVIGAPVDFLAHKGSKDWEDGFRPVDVDFDSCGRLLVSSDGTRNDTDGTFYGSKLVRIEYYKKTAGPTVPAPTKLAAPSTTSPAPKSPIVQETPRTSVPARRSSEAPIAAPRAQEAPHTDPAPAAVQDSTVPLGNVQPTSNAKGRLRMHDSVIVLTVALWRIL
jgi:glucose/arabinose dehydrogenase